MFIIKRPTPNSPRKTIQIVENYRMGSKVRQRILAYVGVINSPEDEAKIMALAKEQMLILIKKRGEEKGRKLTDDEAKSLTKRGRKKSFLLPQNAITHDVINVDINNLEEEYRLIDGVDDIVGSIFDNIGFNNLLRSSKQNQLLKDVVLSRMIYSHSKYKLCETMQNKFDKHYNEDQIYRMMDNLYPKISKIKQLIFNKIYALMPEVNVLLFDVTTLHCESIRQDGLREYGFSKDGKFNNTQLVLALATNEMGLPIGYELFPGNFAEVKTLLIAINKWNELFNIKNVCFIGDRAMFSENNINLIEECGYQYIIAAKLRSQSQELQRKILDENNYRNTEFADETGRVAEFDYQYKIDYLKCEFNSTGYGYTVLGHKGKITGMQYTDPDGVITTIDNDLFNQRVNELNRLRCYTSRCKCILMTNEEYNLKQAHLLNDVAIVVDQDVAYNGKRVSILQLSGKKQAQILATVAKGKISNAIMIELFQEHYSHKSYINIPHKLMLQLFPKYKISKRRICVSYKPSRASNDAYKRQRILAKLKPKEGSTNKILKTSAKMYMLADGEAKLDEIKIAEAEKWDGIHGVLTNISGDKPEHIISRYSNLWRIEEAFRINKHNLSMRPIYHWKPERINTHIAICYMAFTLLKLVQYQTQITQPRFTINNILEILASVESSIYADNTNQLRYRMPGCISDEAKMLYQAFGIKRGKKLMPYNKM